MDSIADTPPPATNAAAGASAAAPAGQGTIFEIQLAALRHPALVQVGGAWLSAAARLWVEWATYTVQEAMEHSLDRPVSIDLLAADPGGAKEIAFAIEFDHPGAAGGGLITLDLSAARNVVEALQTDFANVRGAGALSESELGLLEYATLAALDRVLHGAGDAPRAFALRSFKDAREALALIDTRKLPSVAFRFRVAGRDGIARLHVAGLTAQVVAHPAEPARSAGRRPDAESIDVAMALPPIRVPRKDAAALATGDVLLAGATDLTSFGACRVATLTGWTIAPAVVVRDSPTVTTIKGGPFALEVLPAAPADSAEVVLNCLVGSQKIIMEQVRRWQTGVTLDLAKDVVVPVDIFEGLTRIGRGELVRLDGEIGIRLAEVSRP